MFYSSSYIFLPINVRFSNLIFFKLPHIDRPSAQKKQTLYLEPSPYETIDTLFGYADSTLDLLFKQINTPQTSSWHPYNLVLPLKWA